MRVIKTVVWVLLLVALALFSLNNWQTVEVRIWDTLVLETKLPALVVTSFLLGLLPMWALSKARRWRLNRKINTLETSFRTATQGTPSNIATTTQLDAAASENSLN